MGIGQSLLNTLGLVPRSQVRAVLEEAQQVVERAYEGGGNSPYTFSMVSSPQTADKDVRDQGARLMARAREEFKNNPTVTRYVSLLKKNVSGPRGVMLKSQARNVDGSPDMGARAGLMRAWEAWGKKGVCEVSGGYSFRTLQQYGVGGTALDGEVILRERMFWRRNDFGYALQVIDPARLDWSYNENLQNGNFIRMGIECEASTKRPVRYWFNQQDRSAYSNDGYSQIRDRVSVPADEIIHLFRPDLVDQSRGVTGTHPVLIRLNMMRSYAVAELAISEVAAKKGVFFTDAQDGRKFRGGRRSGGRDYWDASDDGLSFGRLPHGVEMQKFDVGHPNKDFAAFYKAIARDVASGFDLPYNTVFQDAESVNYSSIRWFGLDERDTYRDWQYWLIESLHDRIIEPWVRMALLNGQILNVTGAPIPATQQKIDKLTDVQWQPRGWEWVDPDKASKAAERGINNLTHSISSVIRERGDDPDRVFAEIKEDEEKLQALGLQRTITGGAGNDAEDEDESESEASGPAAAGNG